MFAELDAHAATDLRRPGQAIHDGGFAIKNVTRRLSSCVPFAPPPESNKTTARHDKAGNASTGDGTGH